MNLKLDGYKQVSAYGLTFIVPDRINYIAIDDDGPVTAFENKPYKGGAGDYWLCSYGYVVELFSVQAPIEQGIDWRETLVEV